MSTCKYTLIKRKTKHCWGDDDKVTKIKGNYLGRLKAVGLRNKEDKSKKYNI